MSFADAMYFLTTPRGGSNGKTFSDSLLIGDLDTAGIKQIVISHSDVIYAINVTYTWNEASSQAQILHGQHFGNTTTIDLDSDDFIKGIVGFSTANHLTHLTLVTNKGTSASSGTKTGECFRWGDTNTPTAARADRRRLLAFSGREDPWLRSLQGIFFDLPSQRVATRSVNFEALVASPVSKASAVTNSTFTCHLKSAMITLYTGEDRVEFHAHEDTLCKLRFFRSALQGSFKESHLKTIEMPEDQPSSVSALIEYLYTGNYTCTYDSTTTEGHSSPPANVMEGQYHLGVFVTAAKYDCELLAEMATANFEGVLADLDSMDKLRLWRYAYTEGQDVERWRKQFEQYHSGPEVAAWAKELFRNHREDMEQTIAEFPELASDTFRLAICGSL